MPPAASTDRAAVAPLAVVVGDEELLVERAVSALVAAASSAAAAADAEAIDLHDIAVSSLAPGQLPVLAAPSLFGGDTVVVLRGAQDAGKDVAAEIDQLAASAGQGLTSLLAADARQVDCPAVKRFGERLDFLRAEFAAAGRRADDGGLRALLDAVGNDLRELAAACSQLAADTTGTINQEVVARYYRGRAEATGFTVADRACEGKLAEALEQLRSALATGTSPVLVSSALAQGIRSLGLVGSAGRGKSPAALAAELGMPPWKIDRVRQQLRGWTSAGLAQAHAAVAEADAQVKGESASAGYALERAITTIVACRAGG
jgi:DNA polymerase III subunit delta